MKMPTIQSPIKTSNNSLRFVITNWSIYDSNENLIVTKSERHQEELEESVDKGMAVLDQIYGSDEWMQFVHLPYTINSFWQLFGAPLTEILGVDLLYLYSIGLACLPEDKELFEEIWNERLS